MLERKTPVPLYHQLELHLRAAIDSGAYLPGDRLPTESELQAAYNVSRVTVRTALKRLEEDGLVSTQRGRGTFVTSQAADAQKIVRNPARLLSFEEDLTRYGPLRVDVLAVELYPAPQRIASLLDVELGTELTRIRRVGSVGDSPLWFESRYFHPDYGTVLGEEELQSASVTALLETMTGLHVGSSRLRISAGAATREQAKHLELEPGEPVLINEFGVYAEGRPIEAARAIFRGDRYAFALEVFASDLTIGQVMGSAFPDGGIVSVIRQEVTV
jgi:GntR family transcriptional regulator